MTKHIHGLEMRGTWCYNMNKPSCEKNAGTSPTTDIGESNMETENSARPTVMYLLGCLSQKLDQDRRLERNTANERRSCVQSMRYILGTVPHRRLNPDFNPDDGYVDYLRHLNKSIQRNRALTNTDYRNLSLLIQTLQTNLWPYK